MGTHKLRIKTVRHTRIKPENNTFEDVELNALDNFEKLFNIEGIYFYKSTLDAERLKKSLQVIIDDYYLLAGQLSDGANGSLIVQSNAPGALFVESECEETLKDVAEGIHTLYSAKDFITRINPLTVKKEGSPCATFTLTQMKGGGSILGMSFSHALVDAHSNLHFLYRWSQVDAGLAIPGPVHDRNLLYLENKDRHPERSDITRSNNCAGFVLNSRLKMARRIAVYVMTQNSIFGRVLKFSSRDIEALKGAAAGTDGRSSLTAALCAHLWKFFVKIGSFHPDKKYRFLLPATIRHLLGLPQGEEYFGNGVIHIMLEYTASYIKECSLSSLAEDFKKLLSSISAEQLEQQMRWLKHQEEAGRLFRVSADTDFYSGDMVAGVLYRYPMYDFVFDGEAPMLVAIPVIPAPWTFEIMPSPERDGGIHVTAFLHRRVADKLELPHWQAELYNFGD